MNLKEAQKQYRHHLLPVTLCLFIQNEQLLLARKLKKVGAGLLNGPGGKIEPGETASKAMVRESKEELGLEPKQYKEMAHLEFYFPPQPEWNMHCTVFVTTTWKGVPTPTLEMDQPTWFPFKEIPWHKMWADDQYWLPPVLKGQSVEATFLIGPHNTIIEQEVKIEATRNN